MTTGGRSATFLVAVAAVWVLVGPQYLGGPVAAVSTFGTSMQPTYEAQTLVLARRAPSYEVGDIIAYRSETLGDAVVLHRVVAEDADGFITQGDNNPWRDPDRPTEDDILGRAWVAVPRLGLLLDLPTTVKVAALLLLMTGLTMSASARRRRRGPDAPADARPRPAPPPRPLPLRGSSSLVAGSLVGLLVASAAAALAWSTPAREPGPVDYEQHTTFAYTADVPASPAYPDGRLDTGDPIFLQVEDELDVTAEWQLTSDEPASLSGSGQLVAVVSDGNGWERTVPLGRSTEWTGSTATLTGHLDVGRLQALATRAADLTGLSASSLTVAVTADVSVDGTLAGAPLEVATTPSLDLSVSSLRASVASGDDDAGGVTVTESGSLTVPDAAVAQLQLGGLAVDVPTARTGSAVLLVAALVALAVAALATRRARAQHLHDRILATHGDAILQVDALAPVGHGTTAAVPDVEELFALAEMRGLPVMRVPLRAGGYAYVVDDVATRYHCALPAPRTEVGAPAPSESDAPAHTASDDRAPAVL